MRRNRAIVMFAVGALAVAYPRGAAHAAETATATVSVDVSSFPEVAATVGMPDALLDTDLAPGDFVVVENDRVRRATVTPLRTEAVPVVLVVDSSGSMRGEPIEQARAAATSFVAKLPAAWPVAVVGVSARPVLLTPLTSDRQAVAAAIASLVAGGETALYDTMAMVGDKLTADGVNRATVVLLSDGEDSVSGMQLDHAITRLGAGVRLEIVEVTSQLSNHNALERMAAARHGRVTSVSDGAGLAGVYDALARSLRSQYVVRYKSAATGPTDVTITVTHGAVKASGGARVDAPSTAVTAVPTTVVGPTATASSTPTNRPGWLLPAGALSFFLAIALGSLVVALPNRRVAVLGAMSGSRRRHRSEMLSDLAARAIAAADDALEQRGRRNVLNDTLEQAGIALRAGEFLVLAGSAAAGSFVVMALLAGPVLGLLGAAVSALAFHFVVRIRVARRRKEFAEQLPDTVQMLSGALRAGYALVQAIDSVAKEAPAPSSEELHRIVVETRLGRDLTESLRAASSRVGSQDFEWVVQAIEIQREVGGDLAEVLDTVAGTIRERMQLDRHVRALTAEGRLSAYLLLALPPILALALSVINPGYIAALTRGAGLVMTVFSVVLMGVGALWFKKLCRLQV